MNAPKHDPDYQASFEFARRVARAALNRLAHPLTCSRSIASDAMMRLIGKESLVAENAGHMEGMIGKAVAWALKDRLRRDRAAKRGGRDAITSLDGLEGEVYRLSDDASIEFQAYLAAREEFELRYGKTRPLAVRAVEAWFVHGRDFQATQDSVGIEESELRAALLLFVNLFKQSEENAHD